MPAFGYRLFRLRPGTQAAETSLRASPRVLENAVLRAEFDPSTGWLSSLLDKRTGADLVAGAHGEHTQISQDPTDTWGHHVRSYRWPGVAMRTTRMTLREAGPLRARLRVEREWNRSTLVEEFLLSHGADHLEVRVTLDWREQAHQLKLCFPTSLARPVATYEIPFGVVRRPVDGTENPAQSWVDLSDTAAGLAVVSDAKHGYDVSPDPASVGMTAVRSPVYSWHDPRELDADGIYSYQDQGVQTFRYLLVPHAGDWRAARLSRRAAELGAPVRAMLESFHRGALPASQSYVADGGGPVMVTAVKAHEDGDDLIVRAVETTGSAGETTIAIPLAGRSVTAAFGPHQIRTFRVPLDGGEVRETDLIEWDLPDAPPVPSAPAPAAPAGARHAEPDRDSSDATLPAERPARFSPYDR